LSDTVKPDFPDKIQTLNRTPGKPYLLFLKDTPEVDAETLGKKADQLRELFNEQKLHGLTLQEYLIFQRDYTERHKTEDRPHPDTKHWTWLLDSEVPGRVLGAYWGPDYRQVGVHSFTSDDADPSWGARSSAIFEL
jgi:hypothetical protein